jgi:hypothetical protein
VLYSVASVCRGCVFDVGLLCEESPPRVMQPDGSQYAQHEAPPTVRSLAIPSSIQLKMSGDFVQCSSTQLPLHEAQILISGASHAQIGALMSDMRMGVIDGAPWLLTSVEQRRSSGAMSVKNFRVRVSSRAVAT